ncbi:MAG: lipoyl(octanoyl) transferase LipB [Bacteroidota bacterium]|jgi:lipoyl(octanoyl) transferase
MINCELQDLQKRDYASTWDLQKQYFSAKIENKQIGKSTEPFQLIFVEHPHVYTYGKSAEENNMLATPEYLKAMGAEVYHIERGGDITYHGPGQLVAYPIFDLEVLGMGIKAYVAAIERCIIATLAEFDIEAGVIRDRIGVWIDIDKPTERKIAAIGIRCSRYVSMHGLALNVNTDLGMFRHIVPCGIADKAVTSMERELGRQIDINLIKNILGKHFANTFGVNFI